MSAEFCQHSWRHLETCRWTDMGGYNTTFHRVDRFYCEKCLATKDKKKTGTQRETPEWYRSNESRPVGTSTTSTGLTAEEHVYPTVDHNFIPKTDAVFTHCNVCGKKLREPEEDKMGMCNDCGNME